MDFQKVCRDKFDGIGFADSNNYKKYFFLLSQELTAIFLIL